MYAQGMVAAIRQQVTVKADGMIEVRSPDLRAGDRAEVIVLVESSPSSRLDPAESQAAWDRLRRHFGAVNSGIPILTTGSTRTLPASTATMTTPRAADSCCSTRALMNTKTPSPLDYEGFRPKRPWVARRIRHADWNLFGIVFLYGVMNMALVAYAASPGSRLSLVNVLLSFAFPLPAWLIGLVLLSHFARRPRPFSRLALILFATLVLAMSALNVYDAVVKGAF
jgi:hypothetical protein